MSWQDEQHYVPSANRDLLATLVGKRIVALQRSLNHPIEELRAEYSYEDLAPAEFFARAGGAARFQLDDGRWFAVSSFEELVSVIIERVDSFDDDEPGTIIDVADPVHSEPRLAALCGRRIVGVRVLKAAPGPAWTRSALARPAEVALVLDVDQGPGLAFTHMLVDAPDDFAVATTDDLGTADRPTTELMRIP